MWIAINIILIVAGGIAMYYAKEIDSAENIKALIIFVGGVLSLGVGSIGSIVLAIKYIWG
jgi:hypothetical protein